MYSEIMSAILEGIDSVLVRVETDISDGMPVFEMVGYLSSEVKESKERVRTALKNSGISLPVKRITVNFSPANIRKSGSGFDLPITVGILIGMGILPKENCRDVLVVGEMSLDGDVIPINGILSMVAKAKEEGIKHCIIPKGNAKEASLITGITCYPVEHLSEVIELLNLDEDKRDSFLYEDNKAVEEYIEKTFDFDMISGQKFVKRACEVAASGMHNLLLIGPAGSGKTMMARCIPSILPPMTEKEQLELSKIYSVAGLFKNRSSLMTQRPFRNPHHTISTIGLTGGGSRDIKPGEITLAHCGVLFLDEFLEFTKSSIEILRQPMEDRVINITRNKGNYTFPADFMLVAATNPCKCGYFPDLNRCTCTSASIERYLGKMSGPMLDRIDITAETPQMDFESLVNGEKGESSKDIKKRVITATQIQKERFKGTSIRFNSAIPSSRIEEFCQLSKKDEQYMKDVYENLDLSARSYFKILKVARTLADMDESKNIETRHLKESVFYRSIDKKFWER
ncbi:MAG: YifB family Mg chelatase-like AAA ATPase [Lachnospiraceae bacterium]|nr:YifB family Mg chelatase-like AAA ATPase [Lachnospiraceae bacterium]